MGQSVPAHPSLLECFPPVLSKWTARATSFGSAGAEAPDHRVGRLAMGGEVAQGCSRSGVSPSVAFSNRGPMASGASGPGGRSARGMSVAV